MFSAFSKMSIGKKIWAGFGTVLVLLIAVAAVSILGIGEIVGNATQVIEGNKIRAEMVQKEVDHLNWAGQVNALLTDASVTTLDVQTDPHQCAFGKWYYNDESLKPEDRREHAEKLVPALKGPLSEIEQYHTALHHSAEDIKKVFQQPHDGLALSLAHRLEEHVAWAQTVSSNLANESAGMLTYMNQTHNAVDQALSIVKACDQDAALGTEEAQKARALEILRDMRYGEGGADYLWVNDMQPVMLMHPMNPSLEGQNIASTTDPTGKQMFTEMVNTCRQHGGGFVAYEWALPNSSTMAPKLSYVELYEPWDWVIGTGVYLDHTDEQLVARAKAFANNEHFSLGVQTDPTKCAFGRFLADPDTEKLREEFPELDAALAACEEPHHHLHNYATKIENLITERKGNEALHVLQAEILPTLAEIKEHFEEAIAAENERMEGMNQADHIYAQTTMPNLKHVQNLLEEVRKTADDNIMTDKQMLAAAKRTKSLVTVLSIVAGVIAIVAAFFIIRQITQRLNIVIKGLTAGSDQVASASSQVAQSSTAMAEGASEQASSLEETSASLEEMSSMTKQNADNAQQANQVAKDAATAATQGREAMTRMSDAIGKIKESSDETAKIIKTIDEIAFQTNLLALNAAVEAARAGDAGKGFAVVAEEVRNLAQRSAEAARNTQELIEGSQHNSENGVAVSTEVGDILEKIVDSVNKVTQLVAEVSAASEEQSHGIEQVNTAVAQMDKVTQANAASSEEAASASEELSAQANELNDMVDQLVEFVNGQRKNGHGSASRQRAGAPVQRTHRQLPQHAGNGQSARSMVPAKRESQHQKVVDPEQVIPLDDDDMGDF